MLAAVPRPHTATTEMGRASAFAVALLLAALVLVAPPVGGLPTAPAGELSPPSEHGRTKGELEQLAALQAEGGGEEDGGGEEEEEGAARAAGIPGLGGLRKHIDGVHEKIKKHMVTSPWARMGAKAYEAVNTVHKAVKDAHAESRLANATGGGPPGEHIEKHAKHLGSVLAKSLEAVRASIKKTAAAFEESRGKASAEV